MAALLLDTNALIWFLAEEPLEEEALLAVAEAQAENSLYVSPISAWEASLAVRKADPGRRPNLRGQDAATWFSRGRRSMGAKLINIGHRIALEAARVPEIYGIGDPGDCFLIATARVKRLTLVTRDGPMTALSQANPDYLDLIQC